MAIVFTTNYIFNFYLCNVATYCALYEIKLSILRIFGVILGTSENWMVFEAVAQDGLVRLGFFYIYSKFEIFSHPLFTYEICSISLVCFNFLSILRIFANCGF